MAVAKEAYNELTEEFWEKKSSLHISLKNAQETYLKIERIVGCIVNHSKFLSKFWWNWDPVSYGAVSWLQHPYIGFSWFTLSVPLSCSLETIPNKPQVFSFARIVSILLNLDSTLSSLS